MRKKLRRAAQSTEWLAATAASDLPAMTEDREALRARLADVSRRIAAAARRAGRGPASVSLVAITKTIAADPVATVLEAGHRIFGENRVQEARAKWPALRERYPGIELHLVGALQSNKARDAVQLFDAIHSIDRGKIAEAVAQEMARQGKSLKLFIQVNTGEEPQKAGVAPKEVGHLLRTCREELGLAVAGLMCIPPVDEEPGVHFAFLAKLAGEHGLTCLSMGMSADFEKAILFGATHVRIGSEIFGSRGAPGAAR
jgi:pyridoxal phosphate enzyme (YggS family)